MIKFEQLYCGSDCTGPYRVDISLPMTVREFIDEILTDYKSEWGYIGIYKRGEFLGYPRCEYKWGKLLYSLPEEYLDKQIEKVSGSGGWSNSDFILHLANEVVEASPKDQYKAEMVALLTEIQLEIKEINPNAPITDFVRYSNVIEIIQEKINELEGE